MFYPILFLQILFLVPVYSLEKSSSAHIIHSNILTQLSIFYVHPNFTSEYSVLPHIIPANIIHCSILFPRKFFFSPDYPRQCSVLPQYIPSSPRLQQ